MKNKLDFLASKFGYKYLLSIPPQSKIIYFEIGFYLLLIAGSLILKKAILDQKSEAYKRFGKIIVWTNAGLALIGLILVFARYESLPLLSFRFWQILVVLLILATNLYFFFIMNSQVKENSQKEKERKRIEKWLPKSKKKKR
jgi:Ca2+/Na+ antiporter